VAQTITSMSVGSTCRLHASRTLNLLPCISSHSIGEPGKLHTKQAALFAISNLTFYKQWILQCPHRFDFIMDVCPKGIEMELDL